MQENEQQQNWGGHKCHNGMCGCAGHHMGFHILRWVLGIVVVLMAFGFGVQIGEYKAAFESGQMVVTSQMRYGYAQPVGVMYQTGGAPVSVLPRLPNKKFHESLKFQKAALARFFVEMKSVDSILISCNIFRRSGVAML